MPNNQDRGAYLGALFARSCNLDRGAHVIAGDVQELRRVAKALDRLAVAACNYGLTARQEKRQAALEERAATIASDYGFRAECCGDPRGYVVKLFDPADDSAGDGWGGGWGVY